MPRPIPGLSSIVCERELALYVTFASTGNDDGRHGGLCCFRLERNLHVLLYFNVLSVLIHDVEQNIMNAN